MKIIPLTEAQSDIAAGDDHNSAVLAQLLLGNKIITPEEIHLQAAGGWVRVEKANYSFPKDAQGGFTLPGFVLSNNILYYIEYAEDPATIRKNLQHMQEYIKFERQKSRPLVNCQTVVACVFQYPPYRGRRKAIDEPGVCVIRITEKDNCYHYKLHQLPKN